MSTTVIPQKPPLLSPITIETVLKSRRKSPTSVNREFALPSPTIAAAHAYYLESQVAEISGSSIATRSIDSLETQRPQGSPPASPGTLVSHLETFTLTPNPREKQLTSIPEIAPSNPRPRSTSLEVKDAKAIKARNSAAIRGNHLVNILRHSTHTPRRQSASILDVPFLFIHNHLRDWGNVYLFNTASADAFVNAISLRRSSVPVGTAADPTIASSETVIRARVVPKDTERKSFILQQPFDLDNLRARISGPEKPRTDHGMPRRSLRHRRASAHPLSVVPDRTRRQSHDGMRPQLGQGPTPIHVEYALHFLPVLATLLLSSHVRKGDMIDLAVPHPEIWKDVVTWVYTGRPTVTKGMEEVIRYLGGAVD